jgi:hypothetical protein
MVINLALQAFSLRCKAFASIWERHPFFLGGLGWFLIEVSCGFATVCHFPLKCMFEEKPLTKALQD